MKTVRYRKTLVITLAILLVLVGARLALPSVVKRYVNDTLHSMEAYDGSVADIDIHLWRGAYRISGLRIVKVGSEQQAPFFDTEALNLSVEWRNLFNGSVVAEAEFVRPQLNLVQSEDKKQEQMGDEQDWVDKLKELAPIRFNTVSMVDGHVTFRVPGIKVDDALKAEQVYGHITNLTNVVKKDSDTFSDFDIQGRVLNNAPLHVTGSINPLAKSPTFDVNMQLEEVQLAAVNPWLHEFIKADAESGRFELYIEMAAAEGRFKGYAKPLMQDVKIARSDEDESNPLRKAWETIVDVAFEIFENQKEDQVAARVPFSGSIKDPEAGIFQTIVSVLRNAFIGAFSRSLEGSISLRDVKENLKEVRGDGDSKEAKVGEQSKTADD